MVIAFPQHEVNRGSVEEARLARGASEPVEPLPAPKPKRKHTVTEKQLAANRRNARRSTGPRTDAGKVASAANATRHGLRSAHARGICAEYAVFPGECDATFHTVRAELEAELRPQTVLQKVLFPRIAQLAWSLHRLAETEVRVMELEGDAVRQEAEREAEAEGGGMGRWGSGESEGADRGTASLPASGSPARGSGRPDVLAPCEIIARRLCAGDDNGLMRMHRYARGLEGALARLLRQFQAVAKAFPGDGYALEEERSAGKRPYFPAWVDPKVRARQERELADRVAATPQYVYEPIPPEREEREGGRDADHDEKRGADRGAGCDAGAPSFSGPAGGARPVDATGRSGARTGVSAPSHAPQAGPLNGEVDRTTAGSADGGANARASDDRTHSDGVASQVTGGKTDFVTTTSLAGGANRTRSSDDADPPRPAPNVPIPVCGDLTVGESNQQ